MSDGFVVTDDATVAGASGRMTKVIVHANFFRHVSSVIVAV